MEMRVPIHDTIIFIVYLIIFWERNAMVTREETKEEHINSC